MSRSTLIKPTHKAIQRYYQALASYSEHHVKHEGAAGDGLSAFARRHRRAARLDAHPQAEAQGRQEEHLSRRHAARPVHRRRGFWEAKDTDDDLDAEISKKLAKGYPTSNIIFEDTRRAVLYQGGTERYRFDLTDTRQLAALLNEFYAWTEPEIENFHQAVEEFKSRVPELAAGTGRDPDGRTQEEQGVPGRVRRLFHRLPADAQPEHQPGRRR